MKFTDNYLKNLKPQEKTFDLHEGGGFMLRVHPSGTKSFFYRYTIKGKTRRHVIGTYPTIKLSDARTEYRRLWNIVKSGEDPNAKKGELTVSKLVEQYLEGYAKPRKLSWKEDRNALTQNLVAEYGDRLAAELTRSDVITLLKKVLDRGTTRQPDALLTMIRVMYKWAMSHDMVQGNPCLGVEPLGVRSAKDRFLSTRELRQFWKLQMRPDLYRALKLILLTAQRPGEVLGIHRREIEGRWWTIPKERTKNKKQPHKVYLTDMALEQIEGDGYIFPNINGRPHKNTRLAQILKRSIGEMKPFTPHDLRRTAATHLGGLGFNDFLIGKVLNHASVGVTGRVYNLAAYDKEKKELLTAWEAHLREILN